MPNVIILGSQSDIAKGLKPLLEGDGWSVTGWSRGSELPTERWNLILCCLGKLVKGHWSTVEFQSSFESNLFLPIRLLQELWHLREAKAQVCFLAGPNPNGTLTDHHAYYASKMSLLKAVEHMDAESDATIFTLGPGYVKTKMVEVEGRISTPIDRIYRCLQWALSQPKQVIGGRNIHVNDPWDRPFLASRLALYPNMYKLRRAE